MQNLRPNEEEIKLLVKDGEEQWNLFFIKLRKIIPSIMRSTYKDYFSKDHNEDDIAQETYLRLAKTPAIKERVLKHLKNENKEADRILSRIVKRVIWSLEAREFGFSTDEEFTRYMKIINCCQKYNIEPVPENAYKVCAIMNEMQPFSIGYIKRHLHFQAVKKVSLEAMYDSTYNFTTEDYFTS